MIRRRLPHVAATALLVLAAGCTPSEPAPTTPPPAPTESTPDEPDWTYSTPSPTSDGPDDIPDDSLIDEEADQDA